MTIFFFSFSIFLIKGKLMKMGNWENSFCSKFSFFCFDFFSLVQSICSICGKDDHYTFEHFPEHSANSQHVSRDDTLLYFWGSCELKFRFDFLQVPDKPYKNPSRYSVPDGLMIVDTANNGSFVVSFRFGLVFLFVFIILTLSQ